MKLSVCLMVRDEEANIARAVDSVRAVADEIVVVDTGSADQTIPIAQSKGARIIPSEWQDDFSAPHNLGVREARGDWLLWLDADESLLESSIPHLRRCLDRTDVAAFYVLRQEIVDSAEPDRFSEMLMLRLQRRDLPTPWTGRYHNQIVPPQPGAPNFWTAAKSEIRLRHWRQKSDDLLRARRSARILAEELDEQPGNLYVMIELANSLSELQDPRARELRLTAARALRLTDPRSPTVVVIYLLEHLIRHPADAMEAALSYDQLLSMSRRWFPRCVALKWMIALRLFGGQNYAAAAVELSEIIHLIRTDDVDKLVPFDPRIGEDAEFNLGVCLTRLTMLDEAERVFRNLLASPRRAAAAEANLKTISELRNLQ